MPAPRVLTTALPPAGAARRTRAQLRVAGGRAPYAWSLTGRLPAGLRLRATGVLSGTPRELDTTGTFTVVVRVKDGSGQTGTRKLLLRLRR